MTYYPAQPPPIYQPNNPYSTPGYKQYNNGQPQQVSAPEYPGNHSQPQVIYVQAQPQAQQSNQNNGSGQGLLAG